MSILSNLVNSLTTSGVPSAAIPGIVSGLSGGGMFTRPKVLQYCNTILANSANPVIVADAAKDLAEVPGIPASVAALASQLMAMAGNPVEVVQIVQAIETAENSNGLGSLGFGLL
jgi:hypothetical protein